METRSASGDMKFPIDIEELDSILDGWIIQNSKESSLHALQNAGLATKTILEELEKYPHTDEMINILDAAGLLSQDRKQLVYDLLWACKTIKLRQDMQTIKSQAVTPEHAELAAFMAKVAFQKVLSERLCKRIFGDIAWQQKLSQLNALLYRLEPITESKINFVLDSESLHAELLTLLAKIEDGDVVLNKLAQDYQAETANRLCYSLRQYTDTRWITATLLTEALTKTNMHEILHACHLLARTHQLQSFQHHVFNFPAFPDAVKRIAEATPEYEPLDNDCLQAAANNPAYVDAMKQLNICSLFTGREGRAALKILTLMLAKESSVTELIVHYHQHQQELCASHTDTEANHHNEDVNSILYVKLPDMRATLDKLNHKTNQAHAEQRVQWIEDQLLVKRSTGCSL